MKSGFTLIEILVSVTILLLMSGLLIAGYSNYNTNQIIAQGSATFKNNLRSIRTLAASGIKPAGCDTLLGYQVTFPSASTYQSVPLCLVAGTQTSIVASAVSYSLPASVTFSPVPPTILFYTLDRGAAPPTTIKLVKDTLTIQISVLSSGVISDYLASPTATPTPPTQSSNVGIRTDFFDDRKLSLFVGSRIDTQVNFDWGSSKPFAGLYSPDNFSVRFSGFITPPVTDTYTFIVEHNDGVRLYINNDRVINDWNDGAAESTSTNKKLTAGVPYPFMLDMYDKTDMAKVILRWKGKKFPERLVPASVFTQP